MLVMTYSEARQNFATVLDRASADGGAFVKRSDGRMFKITPEPTGKSPFEGVQTIKHIRKDDILNALIETREEN